MSVQAPKCKYVSNFKDGGKTIECSKLDILIGTMEYNNAHSDDVTTSVNPVMNQVFQTARSLLYPNTGMAHCAATNVHPVYYSGGPSLASQSNLNASAYSNLSMYTAFNSPGPGWERGSGGDYYKRSDNGFERFSNGMTSYVPSGSLLASNIPSSLKYGGVKMENDTVNKYFDASKAKFDPNDPIDILFCKPDLPSCLVYRGVLYITPDVTSEELATALFLVFFEQASEIGVSMEPEGDSLIKIFKPSIMAQTKFGREIMKADEILKTYLTKHYTDYRVEEYKAKGEMPPCRIRVWFETSKINHVINKSGFGLFSNSVEFKSNDMKVLYNIKDGIDTCGQRFCDFMNSEQRSEFNTIKKYSNLIMMCKLLFMASSCITPELAKFVERNLKPLNDEYPLKIQLKDFTRNVSGHNIVILRGGVHMMSAALMLTEPWRMSNVNSARVCMCCKWNVEDYMEMSLSVKGIICASCRKVFKYTLFSVNYTGIKTNKNTNSQISQKFGGLKANITEATPKLMSFTGTDDFHLIMKMALARINIDTKTYEVVITNVTIYGDKGSIDYELSV